ncbi:MAG: histidinol dehydrogenase [Deltaproteobacteria bacterium CG_4_8_14_3_um_filter_45_9]|nr:MAG: histidinol dehydrogenase [Deltaproteobacteria bacterium CG03_land_8_20_14_0_80_45_14]PIX23357.1 MAG: histidinol dehydrogenase [Deltaproteobacteria bacterium CG_4_8_14_3_um_filter_45_9]
MKILRVGEKGFDRYLYEVEGRIAQDGLRLEREVRSILRDVRKRGDKALVHYTQIFDGLRIPIHQFQVKRSEVREAYKKVPRDFLGTLQQATRRIRKFQQLLSKKLVTSLKEEKKGIRLGQVMRPLERVGIYVPGGKASYPSTVLMAAIPARVVGVQEILMVTPPRKEGISPAVLVAADLAGVDRIYRIGGVQAIAALAYGTKSIPKVDKIVGPGNQHVATAKRLVYGDVDIDMVAGPSEIVIVSDESTPPSFVAADLISQAEHDEMTLTILITNSEAFGREVKKEVVRQLFSLKRKKVASASLRRRGAILIVKDLDQAMKLVNRIAPEHLELAVSRPLSLIKGLKHAGAVFLGPHTPEAIGDYMAGPNHILPTAGTARFSSPLGVEDFIKRTNLISFTRSALKRFEKDVKRFAEWEGLEGHYQSVQKRMKRP